MDRWDRGEKKVYIGKERRVGLFAGSASAQKTRRKGLGGRKGPNLSEKNAERTALSIVLLPVRKAGVRKDG